MQLQNDLLELVVLFGGLLLEGVDPHQQRFFIVRSVVELFVALLDKLLAVVLE